MNLNSQEKKKLCRVMASSLPLFRAQLGFSQEEMAGRLDVTRQTISAFESGQRDMPWSVFLACLMLFTSRPATNKLLLALEIYTDSLKEFLEAE